MEYYFLLPVAFLLSFTGTVGIVQLARKRHWLDHPNARSSHHIPTPTGGGVSFVLVFVVLSLLVFKGEESHFSLLPALSICCCIAALGLLDDIFKLGILTRIFTQCLVVAGVLVFFGVPSIPMPGFILEADWLLTVPVAICTLWFINLFNFMDGIDGFAGSEFLFIVLSAVFIMFDQEAHQFSYFLLIACASVSGFLVLNLSPAKIFMGDIGSNFLGLFIAMAAIASSVMGLANIWMWLVLGGVFICDASFTLVSRMMNGETWYHAHRRHAYQLATQYFNSHGKVVASAQLINLFWLFPLAWVIQQSPHLGFFLTVLAWLPLFLLSWMIGSSRLFRLPS